MRILSTFFPKHKNMFDSPAYLKEKNTPYLGKNHKKISNKYGKHVSIFQIAPGISTIEIGIDEEQCYTGQVVLKTKDKPDTLLFDTLKCGYDSFFNATEYVKPISFDRFEIADQSAILMVYQYSTDDEVELAEEFGGKPADYFGTIVIYIETLQKIEEIFCFECQ